MTAHILYKSLYNFTLGTVQYAFNSNNMKADDDIKLTEA